MAYVTQGTVQVELKNQTDKTQTITIRINPTQDYVVKRGKEDYIVFIQDDPKAHPEAKVFERNTIFTTTNPFFVQSLINGAFQQTKIEIKVAFEQDEKEGKNKKFPTPEANSSASPLSISIVIESVKIPATL
jgi:hypothetical protein